ncbi:hypothetical protein MLD38_032020 [Melastoma candidum]|uniref:Uncharacterized protein n=1 Tax=Melastoma candidum TaxID=119954 RepID=A0ACB9MSL4_9MYRT|nr:hypothetical protein MLD38_032020 [Melastoma candidum]
MLYVVRFWFAGNNNLTLLTAFVVFLSSYPHSNLGSSLSLVLDSGWAMSWAGLRHMPITTSRQKLLESVSTHPSVPSECSCNIVPSYSLVGCCIIKKINPRHVPTPEEKRTNKQTDVKF